MKFRQALQYISIVALITMFPVLWIYNQKINYRGIFSFPPELFLKDTTPDRWQLDTVSRVLNDVRKIDYSATLSPKVISSSSYGVLGRIVETSYGPAEIYEYASEKHMRKYVLTDAKSVLISKNLVIVFPTPDPQLTKLFSSVI